MTYSETIEYLYGLEASRGWDLKLERVRAALDALGRPQSAFPSLLIAGTNGKGTTAALVHSALVAAGHRVGVYTSPHLVRFTERIRVGHTEIDEDAVVLGVAKVRACASPETTGLTFFEMATLLAFLTFAEAAVDVAVLEVGLGGRLDATNVVEPVGSAITSIGLDHQNYLGSTLGQIALEKAGVMRPGRPTVLGAGLPEEAAEALAARAAEVGVELVCASTYVDAVPPVGIEGRRLRDDGAVALALLDLLQAAHPDLAVGSDDRCRGFRDVRWPGRLEVLPGDPRLILDGAHNAESMRSLCAELPRLAGGEARLVFGALADKPWKELAEMLRPHVREVAVVPVQQPRGVPPEHLAAAFAPHHPTRVDSAPSVAIERFAREDATVPIVATGSLFLVGEVYAGLLVKSGRRSVYDPIVTEARA